MEECTARDGVSSPGMVAIKATDIVAPPTWALLERKLIRLMEEAAPLMVKKYAEPGGVLYFVDDLDDLYEVCYNWGLFYAIGANDELLNLALRQWNATTRSRDDRFINPARPRFRAQVHNEYYNLRQPDDWHPGNRLCSEWHHMGEGNMAFYDFGVACPTVSENVRRARRFAAMFIGEDSEAQNYDSKYKILRSPMQSSEGPYLEANLIHVQQWFHGWHKGAIGKMPKPMGTRATLYPIVEDLQLNWMDDPKRADEIVSLFNKVVLNGDSANNLAATALVTNAYLYTGDEKYKRWVLEYVEAWMDRIEQNGGILPDNVGPTGKIGENREGQWWGGLYGWNHYQGFNIIFHGLTVAAECALLLTGDYGYLNLLRSQIKVLLENSVTREDGQLLVPTRYGPKGWHEAAPMPFRFTGPQPMRMQELAHLYHASMSAEDYELIVQVRDAEIDRDWNAVPSEGEKNGGATEFARFQYYDHQNSDWPDKILQSEYRMALAAYEHIRSDARDVATLIAENAHPHNPIFTKGLTQLTLGAPQSVYNGGLLRATVRYFDADRNRPGLPQDVAALVDKLGEDCAGIQLVNLSRSECRNLIVSAGAFGEHQFTGLRIQPAVDRKASENAHTNERRVPVDDRFFAVQLPPSSSIRVEVGMRRFVNQPSYDFPWHGNSVSVGFQ